MTRQLRTGLALAAGAILVAWVMNGPGYPATGVAPHNVILFVPDGLRAAIVDEKTAPAFAALRREGVDFANSHSIFPTFTTANAAGFATGHFPGDTGDFSNTIYAGFAAANAGSSVTPFLENDDVIREMNLHFGGNYLNETTVMAAAREAGYSTAAIGKLGPVLIQDLTAAAKPGPTIVIDDDTNNGGIPLAPDIRAAIKAAGLPPGPAPASLPNTNQQKYFVDVLAKVVLPRFRQANKPFFIVFWSRDPDGTQHAQQDKEGSLTPGINGASSMAAIRNADNNLAAIRAALQVQGLAATTDIIVSADHGFATAGKESKTSRAAKLQYDGPVEVAPNTLPPGFVAIDLAAELHLPLYDTDRLNTPVDYMRGGFPSRADGALGADPKHPDVIVAANAGSDLVYLPSANARAVLPRVMAVLLREDYVSGLFVDDALGPVPGALPLSAINLAGSAKTPRPAIVINFRSFDTGCGKPLICGAVIADSTRLTGHGEHGSLSRAQTLNFMAATGPDFKSVYRDDAPASNADIALTIASLLHLHIVPKGKQMGRVLGEALAGGPAAVKFERETVRSTPANGVETVLNAQKVGNVRYLDSAEFETVH